MFLLWTALLVIADQWTKRWAQLRFTEGGAELELGLGFSLTYVRNDGAAFGLFRSLALPIGPVTIDGTLLLGLVSALVSVALISYLARRSRELPFDTRLALTLILAGAIGNMIDRFARGYVVDFVHFQQGGFNFAVFNLADSLVVVGAGLLILSAFFAPHPRAADAAGGAADPSGIPDPHDAADRERGAGAPQASDARGAPGTHDTHGAEDAVHAESAEHTEHAERPSASGGADDAQGADAASDAVGRGERTDRSPSG